MVNSIEDKVPGAYILKHLPSGMYYVGSAISLYERCHAHCSSLKGGYNKNARLQAVFTTTKDLEFIKFPFDTLEEARRHEQLLLDNHYGTKYCCNTVNSAYGGWVPGTMPEKERLIRSERASRLKIGNTNMLGKKHSEETKEKMSKAQLARPAESFRRGYTVSDETRAKMRIANSRPRSTKGQAFTEERRANMRKAAIKRGLVSGRPVVIDNVTYPNATYAAQTLHISRKTVVDRVKDPRYENYKYEGE